MLWLLARLAAPLFAFGFHPLHHFGIARPFDALLFGLTEEFGPKVMTALNFRLRLFDRDAVGISEGVLPDASHLPGDLDVRLVSLDREAMARDLAPDEGLRELADDRELVAEVAVERLEVIGQSHGRFAVGAGRYDAVVDVHHIGRFDERVVEIFVGRIERMVNLERAAEFREVADDVHVAAEAPRPGRARPAVDGSAQKAAETGHAVPGIAFAAH